MKMQETSQAFAAHNARQLYADVFWYGVLAGSAVAFLPVYAARLAASSFQIGLLTAGPAVVNLLLSLLVARWLEQQPLVRATFQSSVIHRLGYGALVVLPWALTAGAQTWAIPALITGMAIPGTVLAISFNAMFADVVPPEDRSRVVGRRNALMAMSMMGASVVCGALLDGLPFPFNYQIVFGVGVGGAALSSYFLARILPPTVAPRRLNQPLNDLARPGGLRFLDAVRDAPGLRFLTRSAGRQLLRLDLLRSAFGLLLLAFFLFYTFQFTPVPLFPLVWVNTLHLPDSVISWGSALFQLFVLAASLVLPRLTHQFGSQRVLAASALGYAIYPLVHGLVSGARAQPAMAAGAGWFLVASAVGGGVWGLAGATLITRLMERAPDADRPAHMALHNLALNLGILAGSFLGPALNATVGLQTALLLAATMRVVAGLLLWRWG
jgi:MFS family permease